jgi:Tat protein secretion system quality control protein TatD with DNase activity
MLRGALVFLIPSLYIHCVIKSDKSEWLVEKRNNIPGGKQMHVLRNQAAIPNTWQVHIFTMHVENVEMRAVTPAIGSYALSPTKYLRHIQASPRNEAAVEIDTHATLIETDSYYSEKTGLPL